MSTNQHIAQRTGQVPVRPLCRVLRVAPGAYYAWHRPQGCPIPDPDWQVTVCEVFSYHAQRYGTRRLLPEALVSETLRRTFVVRRPPAGPVFHSDQGSQYTATRFKGLVAKYGALQSMSRRGNCYDNAHAESFWSRFKAELLDGGRFPELEGAKLEISHHIAYYNAKRRHSALGYLAQTTSKSNFKQRPSSVQLS